MITGIYPKYLEDASGVIFYLCHNNHYSPVNCTSKKSKSVNDDIMTDYFCSF